MTIVVLAAIACGKPAPPAPTFSSEPARPSAAAPALASKYAATEILVAFRGATGAPAAVLRTDAEAQRLATELQRRITAGEPMDALARRQSDGPSAPRGGTLGVWRPGTMIPEIERAVQALAVGQVSAPVRSAYGWHVLRRDVVEEIEASHVLVPFAGSWRSTATRAREEALTRIAAAQRELEAGVPFAQVAATYSEDETAKHGGKLGEIARGQLVPALEAAAFTLQVGQRSAVVETPYGFHLIERTK